jgi:hypothetical protein
VLTVVINNEQRPRSIELQSIAINCW